MIFASLQDGFGEVAFSGQSARVIKGGETIVDWTSGTKIGGIPAGSDYKLEVRNGGAVTSSDLTVGVVVLTIGQSNMTGWFTDETHRPTTVPSYRWNGTDWVQTPGAGATTFANVLGKSLGDVPVAFVDGSVPGTALLARSAAAHSLSKFWLQEGQGTFYQNAVDQLKAASVTADLVIWIQGEAEGSVPGMTAHEYASGLTTLFARVQADLDSPPIVIGGLQTSVDVAGSPREVKAGQAATADAMQGVDYVQTLGSLETTDGTHLTGASRAWQATTIATKAADLLGDTYRGPVDVSVAGAAGGTAGATFDQRILGSDRADSVAGGSGNDLVRGAHGTDRIDGHDGHDLVSGGSGDDILSGGRGNDGLYGDEGADTLKGGDGQDVLSGGGGDDFLYGEGGNDSLDGGTGKSLLDGGDGNDVLAGRESADVLIGGAGNDTLYGYAGNDTLQGGDGNDWLEAATGDDRIFGGAGNDFLHGRIGSDEMHGGAGNDTYTVDNIGDTVDESDDATGVDVVSSSIGFRLGVNVENLLLSDAAGIAGTGNDLANRIAGGAGDNLLHGGAGADTLLGMAGDDRLEGGAGNDTLTGGAGSDIFAFGAYSTGGIDRIVDFSSASGDRILLRAEDFALSVGHGLDADGALDADYFETGSAAHGSHGQFLFDTSSRTLFWDADGAGGAAAVALASFVVPAAVPAASFLKAADLAFVADLTPPEAPVVSLLNDTGTAGDGITSDARLSVVTAEAGGRLTYVVDGGPAGSAYDPAALSHGRHTVSVTHTDATGNVSQAATIRFVLSSGNHAPVLTGTPAALAHGTQDTSYTLEASDLLSGFTDADGDALSVTGLTASLGTVVDNGGGSYTITPPARAVGPVSLSYTVTDGRGGTVAAHRSFTLDALPDAITGTSSAETLTAPTAAGWTLNGLGGKDSLIGAAGGDTLNGGEGNDTLDGRGGNDRLFGDEGSDRLLSGSGEGNDRLDGGAGVDTALIVRYAGASIFALADPAAETAFGGTILENVEQVIFYAGAGGDRLTGGAHADQLYGNAGDDTLTGLGGNDLLNGGTGTDTAAFTMSHEHYAIRAGTAGVFTVTGDGIDQLTGIEIGRFADGAYDFATGNFTPDVPAEPTRIVGGTAGIDALTAPTAAGWTLRARLEIHGWVFRRSRLPPMATRIIAFETSMRAS